MPHYIIFNNKNAALNRSRQEAVSRDCGPETLYWWPVKESTEGQFVLEVEANVPDAVFRNPKIEFINDD